jgi:DNA helicase-2/ATP-dependent DNA helicase PcrA
MKTNLNERQHEASIHKEGPLMILAGAGAGKTKTITSRISELIKSGVAPETILAITFTNKAAKEMRERVTAILSNDPDLNRPVSMRERPFVSTFHSMGVHILKENAHLLGLTRNFTIFDRDDSKRAVKAGIVANGLDPKQFEPAKILGIISREKGNGMSFQTFKDNAGRDYMRNIVSNVWEHYESRLKKEKALDFDDLLLKTMILLRDNEAVRERYQKTWQYIHIDEYQDTNEVQYKIARLLLNEKKNICVVGDIDQCLLPDTKIKIQNGVKKICDLKSGETVISSAGGGDVCESRISKVKKKKYKGEIIEIQTKKGKILKMTPEHIVFAGLNVTQNIHYVYLMYKRSLGFRIGIVQGIRSPKQNQTQIGPVVRCNQENADKMWILKVCTNRDDAQYFEQYFSTFYGIPMIVFHVVGRRMSWTQDLLNKLYKNIPTEERAMKLLNELKMSFDYPHYFPQGTTNSNASGNRLNIRLAMFSDNRKSLNHPWGLTRISINSNNLEVKEVIEKLGFRTRKGKANNWRVEIARLDYGEAESLAKKLSEKIPDSTLIKTVLLTKNKRLLFQPASNLHPTMKIGILDGDEIIEDEVIKVTKREYIGDVYDLDIENTHNYIANNIVVHNCIYSWRGADIENILNFENDYPDAKIVVLEQNYRSTKTILGAANDIIKKNKNRREKNMFTENAEGEKVSLYTAYDENDEARYIARTSQELFEQGVKPEQIAVLYRTNFQSRAIEEAFLSYGIAYELIGTRFFERKEVKDILSFIRFALNPESLSDLTRIINVPPRGIGKVTLLKIIEGKEHELPGKAGESVASFRRFVAKLQVEIASKKPSEVVKFIFKESGIETYLMKEGDEGLERIQNIKELVTLALKYDAMPQGEGIEKMLEETALASDQDEVDEKKPAVKLMTIHASKGLEFDHVFVTGLEEGLFPSRRDGEEKDEEEERRLMYVAVTRAGKKVFLSCASVRTIFGEKRMGIPSEFIGDIGEEHFEEAPEKPERKKREYLIDF